MTQAIKREDDRLDARRAARVAWDCIDALAARRLRRQPCMKELPVCAIGDTARCSELMNQHGVVVFRNVLSSEEIRTSESKFWDWAETASPGLKRSDPKTHADLGKMGWGDTGIVAKQGISQSPFMWGVRLAKGVRQAWATVLESNDLSVSFDGAGACPCCGAPMDRYGDHALRCPCGGDRTVRHNDSGLSQT